VSEARVRPEWRTALATGATGAALLALLGALSAREPAPRGDDQIYELISRHPFGVHTFPFGYRIGLPLTVNVLPFGHTFSFRLLAVLAAAGAGAFAFLLMRELGTSKRLAAVAAAAMCVSPPFLIVVLRNGRNTDIATVFLLMAGTYFLIRRAYWQLALVLLVGAAVREAVLFLVPLSYAVWAHRPFDRRAAARALAVAAPALAGYAAIRAGIDTVGSSQVPGYGGSLIGERVTVVEQGLRTAPREARRLLTVYGPLWALAPFALRDMRFARRGLVLVALCALAMTFALDWGRMALLAAPVVYPAAMHVLERHRRWVVPVLASALLLIIGYAIYMDRSGVRNGIVHNPPPPYPVR
jgi:hypothetical protein